MKKNLLLLFLFGFPFVLVAQDTIFVRTGQNIPAIIVEKNDTEIKYKKFGQPEPAAIYSIFVSDIKSIHYKDGIIADYTQTGQPATDNKPAAPIEKAGTMNAIKFSLGGGVENFTRKTDDALLLLWRNRLNDPKATIGGNPVSFPFIFKMNMALGNMKRNWLGAEVQFIITPSDAIYATNSSGTYEIKLKNFYSNITMYYARSLNHKNNLLATIETGLDLAFMSGYIKDNNISYNMYGNTGGGFHTAIGVDWLLSKRITASLRGGYRSMKIKAQWEDRSVNPTEYYNFWVIYPPISSQELLTVKWNGLYASFGLQWSFYSKTNNQARNE
ncbi:MAG TPA: hypothetical protein VIK07_09685 [Bacteroidales bacterium]